MEYIYSLLLAFSFNISLYLGPSNQSYIWAKAILNVLLRLEFSAVLCNILALPAAQPTLSAIFSSLPFLWNSCLPVCSLKDSCLKVDAGDDISLSINWGDISSNNNPTFLNSFYAGDGNRT